MKFLSVIALALVLYGCESPTRVKTVRVIETQYVQASGFALYFNVRSSADVDGTRVVFDWWLTKIDTLPVKKVWVECFMFQLDRETAETIAIVDSVLDFVPPPDSTGWHYLDDATGTTMSKRVFQSFDNLWPGMTVVVN